MVPDSSRAEIFLMRAMEFAFEQGLGADDPVVIDIWLRLAYNHVWVGKLDESITIYRSVLETLVKSGKEENLKRSIDVAKKIGDLYVKVQEFDIAEKYFCWAIKMSQGDCAQLIKEHTNFVEEHPSGQKKYDLALPLYLGVLKMIRSRPKDSVMQSKVETKVKDISEHGGQEISWNCLEAIIMGHIGEVFYGLGKREEALGWMQRGLNVARDGSGIRDCDECAGAILYNLGLIYEKDGKTETAISLLNQAMGFAEKAQDLRGIEDCT
ncbi:1480_t:CDS:2, partial [Acaulospora colombiana]